MTKIKKNQAWVLNGTFAEQLATNATHKVILILFKAAGELPVCNRVYPKELDDDNAKCFAQLAGNETCWDIDAKLFSSDLTLKVVIPGKHVLTIDLNSTRIKPKLFAKKIIFRSKNSLIFYNKHLKSISVQIVKKRVIGAG